MRGGNAYGGSCRNPSPDGEQLELVEGDDLIQAWVHGHLEVQHASVGTGRSRAGSPKRTRRPARRYFVARARSDLRIGLAEDLRERVAAFTTLP